MGMFNWLNSKINSFINRGNKFGSQAAPAMNWLQQNVPAVQEFVQQAQPALNLAGKVWDGVGKRTQENEDIAAGKTVKRQKLDLPTMAELQDARGAIGNVRSSLAAQGGARQVSNKIAQEGLLQAKNLVRQRALQAVAGGYI
jgi:hypothetical protein